MVLHPQNIPYTPICQWYLHLSFNTYFAGEGILLSSSPMKVLALIEDANAVCCRYRIEGFAEVMADLGVGLEVVRFQKGLLNRIGNLRKAKSADVVVLQRKLLPLWQLLLLRRWSKRLIFDVDDAVFQRDSNSSKGSKSRSRSGKYRAAVSKADLIIAGNDYLGQVTAALIGPDRVCVNSNLYRHQPV